MTPTAKSPYAGYRFPGEVISHAVWLYFRFPLSLRMVEEMLAARGIDVSHETVRQWARTFGQGFANQIRRRLPGPGDKWHLDEVCLMIRGQKHWLWRAVDQDGIVLDVLVQKRRDKQAAKRLLRKLLKKQCRAPRVMITDKLASYSVSGVLFLGRGLEGGCGRIGPGQELVEAALGMAGDDAADHVGQVGSRLDADQLAGLNQRRNHRPVRGPTVRFLSIMRLLVRLCAIRRHAAAGC